MPPVESTILTADQTLRDQSRIPLAESIVDAYPNWNDFFSSLVANWSPDGKRIVFGSLRDGLPEIYESDAREPASPVRAVTRGPERSVWARYSVNGKDLLFLRDAKGDENHHIWRVNRDATQPVDLTPGEPMRRDEPVLPRHKPGMMLYSASRTTNPSSMLFVQSLSGGEPKLVYTNPRPGGLADVEPGGARALFVEFRSADDLVLHEVDVTTGKARQIYPSEGKAVSISSASYSADGRQ